MNTISQVTMSNAEQVVNIEVEDIIEARLEESEALYLNTINHNSSYFFIVFNMELLPLTEKAGCIVTSSNDGRSWFHKNFFQ